jgi:hypothetical protein
MATMEEYIRGLEQSASRVSALENKLASLQSQMLKQNEGMKKASKEVTKYEGIFTKLGNKIETFMSNTTNPVIGFTRRIVYSFRGAYSALNKLNVTFRTTGKIWDSTIGKVISKTPVLGNILGQTKMPKKGMMNRLSEYGDYLLGAESGKESFLRLGGQKVRERGERRRSIVGRITGKNFLQQVEEATDFTSLFNAVDNFQKRQGLLNKIITPIVKPHKLIIGVFRIAGKVLLKAFTFMILTTAAIIGLVALVKTAFTFLQGFSEGFSTMFGGFFRDLMDAGEAIWAGIRGIFGFIFGDTSFEEMIFGVLDAAVAILYIVVNFAVRLVGAIIYGVFTGVKALFDKGIEFFKALNIKKKIGVIAAGILAAVAWLYGFPILMPAIIVGALFMFGKWLINRIGFANGGVVDTGMQIVGERGPELVSLPRGSRVYTNTQTKKMVNSGGTNINNYITINAKDTSDVEMRRIADKIAGMVNNKINRTTSSRTMG